MTAANVFAPFDPPVTAIEMAGWFTFNGTRFPAGHVIVIDRGFRFVLSGKSFRNTYRVIEAAA